MTCIVGLATDGQVIIGGPAAGWARTMSAGYDAIGSGDNLAIGSLHTTRHLTDPRLRVQQALEAAVAHNAAVAEPFAFVSVQAPDVEAGLVA